MMGSITLGMLGVRCSSLWPLTTEQSAVSSRGGTLNKTLEGEAGGDILHSFPWKLNNAESLDYFALMGVVFVTMNL